MKRGLALAVLVLAVVSAACGPDAPGSDAEAGEREKVTVSPVDDPTLVVGDAATTTEDGNRLTVISYESPLSVEGTKPEAGAEFSTIEVEGCASSSSGKDLMHVGPTGFSLLLRDGTRVMPDVFAHADAKVREPALETMDPAPGTCDRGFVTFQTQRGAWPELVVFEEAFVDARKIAWKVQDGR